MVRTFPICIFVTGKLNMIEIKENHSLEKLNSFGLYVQTRFFIEIDQVDDLQKFIQANPFPDLPRLILGEGSNILFTSDYPGIILHPAIAGIEIIHETKDFADVRVGAGENWDHFVSWAVGKNLGGIENLSLIPGSVGAAPVQNIGAYGAEVSEVISSIETINITNGESNTFQNTDCQFGYRKSIFKNELKNKVLITHVIFRLTKDPVLNTTYGLVKEKMQAIESPELSDLRRIIIEIRKEKLPDPSILGNAGSFFKNPEINQKLLQQIIKKYPDIQQFPSVSQDLVKIPAAWLIQECGWKGKRSGNVGSYDKQPLVLINYGKATGQEILTFSERIQQAVYAKFGIKLEREVNVF